MRVLIALRSQEYYRFVEAIVAEVARRGGETTLVAPDAESLRAALGEALPERLRLVAAPARPSRALRLTREVRSYLHWRLLGAQPDFLLDRWLNYIPRALRGLLRLARRPGRARRTLLRAALRALAGFENAISPDRDTLAQLRELRPDVVLISPLVYPFAWEIDYLKACQALGQPHAALVASWDNLTSKGIFHARPETVLVWNQIQVEEAQRYHGLPQASVKAIGAPAFDWLFKRDLLERREPFVSGLGLDPALPYVVYVVSSVIQHGDETRTVIELQRRLRELAPEPAQILVRPHPRNRAGWDAFQAPGIIVAAPPAMSDRARFKRDLYNTLYHAAAVVGLNTSVFLEAAILDRPCLTLLRQDGRQARHTQFPHFQYLLDGEFLEAAADERQCAQQIAEIVQGRDRKKEARAAFVRSFIRPNGLEQPASHTAVNLLEQLAEAGVVETTLPAEGGRARIGGAPRRA